MTAPDKSRPEFDHLRGVRAWLRFALRAIALAAVLSVIFFWNSEHSAQEIAVVVATPLIIFNCLPVLIAGVASTMFAYARENRQGELPFASPPVDIKALGFEMRFLSYVLVGGVAVTSFAFLGSFAVYFASLLYGFLDVSWATTPARHLAYELLLIGVLPTTMLLSFLAGLVLAGRSSKFSTNTVLSLTFDTASRIRDWPRAA